MNSVEQRFGISKEEGTLWHWTGISVPVKGDMIERDGSLYMVLGRCWIQHPDVIEIHLKHVK